MSKTKKNEGFEALRYAIIIQLSLRKKITKACEWRTLFFDKNLPLAIAETKERWR